MEYRKLPHGEKMISVLGLGSSSIGGAGEKERPNVAEVIAIGKGEKLEGIKVGEKVVYPKFSGTEIKDGEEKYLVLNVEDVLAVIE